MPPAFSVHALVPHPEYRDGYHLIKRRRLQRIDRPGGGQFVVGWDIRLKHSAETQRKTGEEYAEPLTLIPEADKYGRWDLRVNLAVGVGDKKFHTQYHRVVCLALKVRYLGVYGRRLRRRRKVPVRLHDKYEVDHVDRAHL